MMECCQILPGVCLTSTKPIEFTISAENFNYIDLASTFLYMQTAADRDSLAADTEIAPELTFYTSCDCKSMLILMDSLSLGPTITINIAQTSKICLFLIKIQNRHSFLLSCGIETSKVTLISRIATNSE